MNVVKVSSADPRDDLAVPDGSVEEHSLAVNGATGDFTDLADDSREPTQLDSLVSASANESTAALSTTGPIYEQDQSDIKAKHRSRRHERSNLLLNSIGGEQVEHPADDSNGSEAVSKGVKRSRRRHRSHSPKAQQDDAGASASVRRSRGNDKFGRSDRSNKRENRQRINVDLRDEDENDSNFADDSSSSVDEDLVPGAIFEGQSNNVNSPRFEADNLLTGSGSFPKAGTDGDESHDDNGAVVPSTMESGSNNPVAAQSASTDATGN